MRYRLALFGFAFVSAFGSLGAASSTASTFKVLHHFCQVTNCADGGSTLAGLVVGADGALYGTTQDGGALGWDGDRHGVVFSLTPNARKTHWQYQVLHSFCLETLCADGSSPWGTLILDADGNLYGTTVAAGASGAGTVFKLAPNARRTKWKFSVLHSFCPDGLAGCVDGQAPQRALSYAGAASGAPYDGTSPLYGTTFSGGAFPDQFGNGGGTVFRLTPRSRNRWKEDVLYSFCPSNDCGEMQGRPSTGIYVGPSDNLFLGTAGTGLPSDLYALKQQAHGTWKATLLHHFCSLSNCADGTGPTLDTLVPDPDGNLYGTTVKGGANTSHGTVFKLEPHGTHSMLTTLYSFCAQANCADGSFPTAGVLLAASGDLFGTTELGGSANNGTLYRLKGDGTYDVLHSFCTDADCLDGVNPDAGLARDSSGTLYGTTRDAVFALDP